MMRDACELMGSPARLELVRYFQSNPSSQAAAAKALSIPKSSMTKNIQALMTIGVLTQEPSPQGGRALVHRVNTDRVAQMLAAVTAYLSAEPRNLNADPFQRGGSQ